jgi:hypothetical protein
MCSERVNSSCSTSDTRRVALIIVLIETNDVITYNYVSVVFCSGIFLLHFDDKKASVNMYKWMSVCVFHILHIIIIISFLIL